MATDRELAGSRLALGLFGAIAGLCLWYLFDSFDDFPEHARALLFLTATATTFFGGALVMTGPLSMPRALALAAPLGLVAGGLLWWASFRHVDVEDYLESGYPIAAYLAISFVALPFLVAGALASGGWRDYSALFRQAWSIVVRGATAWLFVGVFWLVYFLSDALLELVNLTFLGDMAEEGWFAFTVSGLVLALALAVLNELSAFLSPGLVLRLLRLLLPVVVVVVALFLVMVPVRGLDNVFGSLSAAATLLAMAIGAITLVTSALDEDDISATESPIMLAATQLQSLLLPVLAGLAGWAVWIRVAQYGWTPDRLVAATAALIVMIYALLYCGAVLWRRQWMVRIRAGNTAMALGLIGLSALWLTPALNPERMSAASQLARFEAGDVSAAELDLWTLDRDWGLAGTAAVAKLRAMQDHPDHATLVARLDQLETARNRYDFEQSPGGAKRATAEALVIDKLRVYPPDAAIPDGLLTGLQTHLLHEVEAGCRVTLKDGTPGCVLAMVDLVDTWEGPEAALFLAWGNGAGSRVQILRREAGRYISTGAPFEAMGHLGSRSPDEVLGAVLDGRFTIGPPSARALIVQGTELIVRQ